MLKLDEVMNAARAAKEHGATRFCMGAAWREVKDGPAFDRVLDMVRGVKGLGLEACVTLGMLNEGQAAKLKAAGLDAYNHNLDTSRENYKSIISTRTYDDRLKTLKNVRNAGITVCSGGIIGMGESIGRSLRHVTRTRAARAAPRERAGQCFSPSRRHAACGLAPHRSIGFGARGRDRAHHHAALQSPAERWTQRSATRGPALVPVRGREQHLLRRQALDHAQPGHGRGRGFDPRGGSSARKRPHQALSASAPAPAPSNQA